MAYTVTVVATAVLGVVTALGMIFAPAVVKVVAPGFSDDPQIVALTVHLMRLMFPTVVILGVAGIFMGILNSYNHFTLPAVAPIVWNVVIIGVVVAFSAGYGFKALAWGVLAGTAVELLLQVPAVWKRRWRPDAAARASGGGPEVALAPGGGPSAGASRAERRVEQRSPYRLALRSPEVRRVGILIGPVILSLGIINFNAFIDTIVATLISIPAPAIIDKAFRLFQLPQGVFAIAIGTVLFPAFSRHAAANRMKEFREDLSTGLRQIFFVTLPFAAFFAVLALPTVRLIYEHGKVTSSDAALVASALTFFSVGMAFVSVNTLLNRAFYSIQKPWLPLFTGVINLALNARARPPSLQTSRGGRHHALDFVGQPVQLLRAHVPARPTHRRGGRPQGGLVGGPVDRGAHPAGGSGVRRMVGAGRGLGPVGVGADRLGRLGVCGRRGGVLPGRLGHAHARVARRGARSQAPPRAPFHRRGDRPRRWGIGTDMDAIAYTRLYTQGFVIRGDDVSG